MLTLINTSSEWRNKRSLIPWLALWTLTNQNCQLSLVVPNVADELTRGLKLRGFRAEGIHGDLWLQTSVFSYPIKNDQIDILVATDVAARVVLTFQVSLTSTTTIFHKIQSYVHRIGRTGRAGQSGQSITFCSTKWNGLLWELSKTPTKKRMKGLKPPTAQEAFFHAKKKGS